MVVTAVTAKTAKNLYQVKLRKHNTFL